MPAIAAVAVAMVFGGLSLFHNGIMPAFLISSANADTGVSERPNFSRGMVEIVADGKRVSVPVEFAKTYPERQHGLMHLETLPAGTGMLFIFEQDGKRSFWMKNTLIPLDMLFFDSAGRLVTRIDRAAPQSFQPRRSTQPAQYVLEINGGEAQLRGWSENIRLVLPLK